MAIGNTIVFVNGKGGVLKTTGAAHLAGYAATSGWDVLVIDADGQANQSRDLGYVPDGGTALAAALTGNAPLNPLRHPKWENLSYVAGGPAVDGALDRLKVDLSGGRLAPLRAFERALEPVAADYHLIVIDSPPRELLLRKLLFVAARFLVVPCQVDEGSIDGIADVFETAAEVRDVDRLNPDLEVLGAYLGPVQTGATKTERLTRERINMLVNQQDFVFASTIRSAQSIAVFCRQQGILSNEYERLAADAKQNRRWWRMSKEERQQARGQHTWSDAAPGLAADWQELVDEIMARFQARLGAFDPAGKPSGV